MEKRSNLNITAKSSSFSLHFSMAVTTPIGTKWLSHSQAHLKNTVAVSKLGFPPSNLKALCTLVPTSKKTRADVKVRVKELKESWLDSLSYPFEQQELTHFSSSNIKEREEDGLGNCVVGIDPDVHGALALLKDDDCGDSGVSAQVFDTPHLPVLVGKRVRKRLDARSLVQLLHSFGAPIVSIVILRLWGEAWVDSYYAGCAFSYDIAVLLLVAIYFASMLLLCWHCIALSLNCGTTAYIEQSSPFPQDGKQGWWSGGFTYGLWIGILVSSGFSVVPVPSRLWKDQFQLYRNSSTKDDSRKAASDLFPSLSSSLKRKKDHGRADALLIAAYGKGVKLQSKTTDTSNEVLLPTLSLKDMIIDNEELEPINIKTPL